MSKAIIMSSKPKLCEKIINRIKTVEIRNTKPRLKTPFKVYVYCTTAKNDKDVLFISNEKNEHQIVNGLVVGEFVCDKITAFNKFRTNERLSFVDRLKLVEPSGMTVKEIEDYAKGKTLYLWNIKEFKLYDEPISIEENSKFKRPQSWYYMEDTDD